MSESVGCVLQADSAQGLSVAGNQAVTVLSGGNMGIGTTNPESELQLSGSDFHTLTILSTDDTDPVLQLSNTVGTGIDDWTLRMDDSDADKFQLRYDGTPLFSVGVSGNVDITGSDTDAYDLTLNKDSIFLRAGGRTGNSVGDIGGSVGFDSVFGGSTFRSASIAAIQSGSDANNTGLAFFTHPSDTNDETIEQKMIITHAGNVGIGVASPTAKLHVNGGVKSSQVFGQFHVDTNQLTITSTESGTPNAVTTGYVYVNNKDITQVRLAMKGATSGSGSMYNRLEFANTDNVGGGYTTGLTTSYLSATGNPWRAEMAFDLSGGSLTNGRLYRVQVQAYKDAGLSTARSDQLVMGLEHN